MFKVKQIFVVVFAAVITVGSAAITFGTGTSLKNHASRAGKTRQGSAVKQTHSARHRHHRRSAGKRSKRLPNAKSLQKESW